MEGNAGDQEIEKTKMEVTLVWEMGRLALGRSQRDRDFGLGVEW